MAPTSVDVTPTWVDIVGDDTDQTVVKVRRHVAGHLSVASRDGFVLIAERDLESFVEALISLGFLPPGTKTNA